MIPHAVRTRRTCPLVVVGTAIAVAVSAPVACANNPMDVFVDDSQPQTIQAEVGRNVNITLQTVGEGRYGSPPTVSSAAVKFLDESDVYPTPADGPTQLFRFSAVSAGTAIVDFENATQAMVVEDTIVVK
jgi:hypothetical protein